ncbi:hypothetical protein SASPL_127023 [Salvia splendens]|uniref:Uncharacterized protein n=1 Tax=Salvia splendens TaxID=180675 RepID=A0A8X8XJW0_SALSN|nr:hypothetical protein SASPL_127023 [Salvia splendens]
MSGPFRSHGSGITGSTAQGSTEGGETAAGNRTMVYKPVISKRIEDDLRKEFPETDLKGTPHADKNAKFMRHKPWLLCDEWNVIFGKYRASGSVIEDIAKGAAAIRHENVARYESHNVDPSNDYVVNLDDFVRPHPQKNGTKRKPPQSTDAALLEFLGQMHSETNKRLNVIASRIGYEFDLGQAIHHKLGSVASLTVEQRYELSDILADRVQRLEVFLGMAEDVKPGYVHRLVVITLLQY